MSDPGAQDRERFREIFPFEAHFLEVDGQNPCYFDEGTGPALVLIHSCPMSAFAFRSVIREFRTTMRVVAYDQLGFGRSDKPLNFDYRIENHIEHLERLLNHLGISDHITLVMHGRGAAIGMGYAARHPESVDSFVVMNAMSFSDFSLPFRLRICKLPILGNILVNKFNFFLRPSWRYPKIVRDAYLLPFPRREDRCALMEFINSLPCAPEDKSAQSMIEIETAIWSLREKRALILWGEKDWLYTKRALRKWTEYFPSAKVVMLPLAGRFLMEDDPAEFITNVREFFGEGKTHP